VVPKPSRDVLNLSARTEQTVYVETRSTIIDSESVSAWCVFVEL